jgi:hypothetical protein
MLHGCSVICIDVYTKTVVANVMMSFIDIVIYRHWWVWLYKTIVMMLYWRYNEVLDVSLTILDTCNDEWCIDGYWTNGLMNTKIIESCFLNASCHTTFIDIHMLLIYKCECWWRVYITSFDDRYLSINDIISYLGL